MEALKFTENDSYVPSSILIKDGVIISRGFEEDPFPREIRLKFSLNDILMDIMNNGRYHAAIGTNTIGVHAFIDIEKLAIGDKVRWQLDIYYKYKTTVVVAKGVYYLTLI